ncbi:NACHT domain-containing protein [Flavobacterium sp. GCM10027622]|uniref:NACHT domain-containing protein n=1 Tax=unclassified Flavobacterium TaxID=196869 RepID=UPI00360CEC6F
MIRKDYYVPRFIKKSDKNSFAFFSDDISDFKTLEDYLFEYDKIILLGNPGIGKSKELKNLFDILWSKIDETSLVPFLINLKNFRSVNKFEDLLAYEDWKKLSQIVFILDGLDEISEIQDFLSAFEVFINNHQTYNFKYVISCRTNISEKYLINISNFETFYLEDLTLGQTESLLLNKYDIKIEDLDFKESHKDYLRTPFFVDLLAEYYLTEGKLVESDAKIWEHYVNKQLETHKIKISKKKILNVPQEIKYLKKVAFTSELRQKNFVTNEELFRILGDDYLEFIENPFIVNLEDGKEKFSFQHRQLQEYFVAKTLSEKEFDEILSNIKITGLEKIHPILFNSVAFLINLMENGDSRNQLLNWIEIYQLELLLKADSDRINNIVREKVFQNFFEVQCIEKTYWISTNTSFSVKEISEFGCCIENYNFLIRHIKDNKHFRIVISAIELLSFFNIRKLGREDEFKGILFSMLQNKAIDYGVKSHVINCIVLQGFAKTDIKYLNSIFKNFVSESNKQLNRSLLNLLVERDDLDNYFDFLKEEFLFENNIKKREEKDDVLRGTSFILNELIVKIKNVDNFIELVKYFFDNDTNHFFWDSESKLKVIERCVEFDEKYDDFVLRLIGDLTFRNHLFFSDELNVLISKVRSSTRNKVFNYLLENFDFKDVSYELAKIFEKENLTNLLEKIDSISDLDNKEIEYFRNRLSNREDREVSKIFNDTMTLRGFKFKERLLSDEEVEKIRLDFKNKPQKEFELLFERDLLKNEIEAIFNKYGQFIDLKIIQEINSEWYKNNGHWNRIDFSYEFLRRLVYGFRSSFDFQKVVSFIDDDDYIAEQIKLYIENQKSNTDFKVLIKHTDFITKWVSYTVNEINFDKLILINHINSYSQLEDYKKWELVLFFSEKLNLSLPEAFLLNSLKIGVIQSGFLNKETCFDFLLRKIENKKKLALRIVHNLKEEKLFSSVLREHVQFALDNNLEDSFIAIRKCLLDDKLDYDFKKLLDLYVKVVPEDVDLLIECATNLTKRKSWDAIAILTEKGLEKKFCIEKAIEYLDVICAEDDSIKHFIINSLEVLFKNEDKRAVKYYIKYLEDSSINYLNTSCYISYKIIENYEVLNEIFDRIHLCFKSDSLFNSPSSFLNQYVSNLSKYDESYRGVKKVLLSKRDDLVVNGSDNGVFQINLLLDLADNSYYISKSKPLEFDQALEKVNQMIC